MSGFEQIMSTSHLPQDILIDIFSRLPPKSVGKCRCIAKIWGTLLSTPQFIKSHFTRKPHQENLILTAPSGSVHSVVPTVNGAVSRKLRSPQNCTDVAGSCDGLVLLVDEEYRKFLVNPITLQQLIIRNSPMALNEGESFSMYGLGYDRISDDYKIVMLSYWDTDNEHNPDCADTFVDVYSVKSSVWKRVDNSPYDHAVPDLCCGAFVNGAIHWLASDGKKGNPYPSVIAAFDLAREVFDKIPPPGDVDVEKYVFYKLVVLGGCLCMVHAGRNNSDIWVMKEYGVGESWTKFSIEYEIDMVKPLCFVGDEEVVMLSEAESLVIYNMETRSCREMVVDGVETLFVDGGVFVESLVSPL